MATPEDDIGAEIGALIAPMLKRRLWLVFSEPVASSEEARPHLREHLLHLIELERQGVIFASGPIIEDGRPGDYALIILRADSEQEARRIADEEPLHKRGLRKYTLHEWMLNQGRISLHVDFSSQAGGVDGVVAGS